MFFFRSLPGSFSHFFCNLRLSPSPPSPPKKKSERVFDQIERLVAANPKTMRLDVIEAPPAPKKGGENEKSKSTYSPRIRVVTVEPGGLSPGPPGSAAEREAYSNKYRLLLNYGEHGRELVSVESALVLLKDLADTEGGGLSRRASAAADSDPLRSSLGGSARLRSLLKEAVFKIVPMENEAGRELVERGQLCERKNGRGVGSFFLFSFRVFHPFFFFVFFFSAPRGEKTLTSSCCVPSSSSL